MSAPLSFVTLTGHVAFDQAALTLVQGARVQLSVVSIDLDRLRFGSEPFTEAVKQFLLSHRRARCRILLHQPRNAMSSGHRLVELGRVLSSRLEFRQMPSERQRSREEYCIVDERHLLTRSSPMDLDARLLQDAPLEARARQKTFDEAWHESVPARELSELKI